MRFFWYLMLAVLLLSTSTAHAGTNGRACPGRTLVVNGVPCCLSGVVTLDGKPVEGALVTAERPMNLRGAVLSDVTEYVAGDDVPTYGFKLHDDPLHAQPGDTLLLTVTYEKWTQTVTYNVKEGEQWLNIELNAKPAQGAKPIGVR